MRIALNYINVFIKLIKYVKNWPLYLFVYIGILRKKKIILHFRDGTNLLVRTRFSKIRDSIMNHYPKIAKCKYYTPNELRIEKNDNVVDIGAQIGIFTIFAARKAKNGLVYAYEPSIENFALLVKSINLNLVKNVFAFNLGIFSEKYKKLFLGNSSVAFNIFTPSTEYERINCITLADIFRLNNLDKIDFLKINAEGAEYDIIYNTPEEVLAKINKISLSFHDMKIHPKYNHMSMIKFLEKNNFEIIKPADPNNRFSNIIYAKNNLFHNIKNRSYTK